jgi:hypothetical protein
MKRGAGSCCAGNNTQRYAVAMSVFLKSDVKSFRSGKWRSESWCSVLSGALLSSLVMWYAVARLLLFYRYTMSAHFSLMS